MWKWTFLIVLEIVTSNGVFIALLLRYGRKLKIYVFYFYALVKKQKTILSIEKYMYSGSLESEA